MTQKRKANSYTQNFIYMDNIFVKFLFLVTILVTFCSCDPKNEVIVCPPTYLDNEFIHSLVASQADCDQLVANGTYNCFHSLTILDETKVDIFVTDIVYQGSYVIDDNKMTITFDGTNTLIATENPLVFTLNANFTEMVRISDNSNDVWKLGMEGVAPWDL